MNIQTNFKNDDIALNNEFLKNTFKAIYSESDNEKRKQAEEIIKLLSKDPLPFIQNIVNFIKQDYEQTDSSQKLNDSLMKSILVTLKNCVTLTCDGKISLTFPEYLQLFKAISSLLKHLGDDCIIDLKNDNKSHIEILEMVFNSIIKKLSNLCPYDSSEYEIVLLELLKSLYNNFVFESEKQVDSSRSDQNENYLERTLRIFKAYYPLVFLIRSFFCSNMTKTFLYPFVIDNTLPFLMQTLLNQIEKDIETCKSMQSNDELFLFILITNTKTIMIENYFSLLKYSQLFGFFSVQNNEKCSNNILNIEETFAYLLPIYLSTLKFNCNQNKSNTYISITDVKTLDMSLNYIKARVFNSISLFLQFYSNNEVTSKTLIENSCLIFDLIYSDLISLVNNNYNFLIGIIKRKSFIVDKINSSNDEFEDYNYSNIIFFTLLFMVRFLVRSPFFFKYSNKMKIFVYKVILPLCSTYKDEIHINKEEPEILYPYYLDMKANFSDKSIKTAFVYLLSKILEFYDGLAHHLLKSFNSYIFDYISTNCKKQELFDPVLLSLVLDKKNILLHNCESEKSLMTEFSQKYSQEIILDTIFFIFGILSKKILKISSGIVKQKKREDSDEEVLMKSKIQDYRQKSINNLEVVFLFLEAMFKYKELNKNKNMEVIENTFSNDVIQVFSSNNLVDKVALFINFYIEIIFESYLDYETIQYLKLSLESNHSNNNHHLTLVKNNTFNYCFLKDIINNSISFLQSYTSLKSQYKGSLIIYCLTINKIIDCFNYFENTKFEINLLSEVNKNSIILSTVVSNLTPLIDSVIINLNSLEEDCEILHAYYSNLLTSLLNKTFQEITNNKSTQNSTGSTNITSSSIISVTSFILKKIASIIDENKEKISFIEISKIDEIKSNTKMSKTSLKIISNYFQILDDISLNIDNFANSNEAFRLEYESLLIEFFNNLILYKDVDEIIFHVFTVITYFQEKTTQLNRSSIIFFEYFKNKNEKLVSYIVDNTNINNMSASINLNSNIEFNSTYHIFFEEIISKGQMYFKAPVDLDYSLNNLCNINWNEYHCMNLIEHNSNGHLIIKYLLSIIDEQDYSNFIKKDEIHNYEVIKCCLLLRKIIENYNFSLGISKEIILDLINEVDTILELTDENEELRKSKSVAHILAKKSAALQFLICIITSVIVKNYSEEMLSFILDKYNEAAVINKLMCFHEQIMVKECGILPIKKLNIKTLLILLTKEDLVKKDIELYKSLYYLSLNLLSSIKKEENVKQKFYNQKNLECNFCNHENESDEEMKPELNLINRSKNKSQSNKKNIGNRKVFEQILQLDNYSLDDVLEKELESLKINLEILDEFTYFQSITKLLNNEANIRMKIFDLNNESKTTRKMIEHAHKTILESKRHKIPQGGEVVRKIIKIKRNTQDENNNRQNMEEF